MSQGASDAASNAASSAASNATSNAASSAAGSAAQSTSTGMALTSTNNRGLSTGAKVAIGLVVPVVLIMLGGLIYLLLSRRERKHAAAASSGTAHEKSQGQQNCEDNKGPAELMADSSFKKAGPSNICAGEERHELPADVPAELENTQSREQVPSPVL